MSEITLKSKEQLFRELETLRKRNAELEISADRYHFLFEHGNVGIGLINKDYFWIEVNPKFCEMLGYTEEELKSLRWTDITHPDDLERDIQQTENVFKSEIPFFTQEKRFLKKNGEIIWVILTPTIIKNDNGEILHAIGIMQDITQVKQKTELLAEQYRFEKLISNFSSRFINMDSFDIENEIVYVLKNIVELFGVDRSTLFQFSADYKELIAIGSHAIAGEEPIKRIHIEENFPVVTAKFRRGEIFSFSSENDLPKEAAKDLESLKKINLKSTLAIPISVEGSFNYVISVGTVSTERAWEEKVVERLQLVGEIFVSALVRRKGVEKINSLMDQLQTENIFLQEEIRTNYSFDKIIGKSNSLKYVLHQVGQIAPTTSPVIIMGETGTGKEVIANAIHTASNRKDRPLVRVNCATLPSNLIESELFGHEKGAFTGAHQKCIGRFEFANKSTIFLDEIGELPLELQSKLLRVLENGEFERLGNPKTYKVDVRVIVASNRDLEMEVRENRFREDLFYRLNVFPISLPALRERKEDIPLLVRSIIEKISKEMGKRFSKISKHTIKKLQDYSWPGNIRELENIIERAIISSTEPILKIELPPQLNIKNNENCSLEIVEREHILKVLNNTHWKIKGPNGAAEILKLNPSTLRDRMAKLGIKRSHKEEK
jgi:PAS domain S-box-containing protein